MADPFKPTTTHTINPLDPTDPLLLNRDAAHIQGLTLFTDPVESVSRTLRSELVDFLNRLHALQDFVVHWKALNWLMLGEEELGVFIRLFSLPSLRKLEILASENFPLCLIQHFAGAELCISAAAVATSALPFLRTVTEKRGSGALTKLTIVSAQNIREFRTFIDWQEVKAQACLKAVKSLDCRVSWGDSGAKPKEVMKDIGSLLFKFGAIAKNLEVLRLLDWQNNSFDGQQVAPADLKSLSSLKRLYLYFGASPKAGDTTMASMYTSLKNQVFHIISNLPSPHSLEHFEIKFSFVVPFPWPLDLHHCMKEFSEALESMLILSFSDLKMANLTFDVRGGHTQTYDWKKFNNEVLQPRELQTRNVECDFKAEVYRPPGLLS